jgi:hypothetical protein
MVKSHAAHQRPPTNVCWTTSILGVLLPCSFVIIFISIHHLHIRGIAGNRDDDLAMSMSLVLVLHCFGRFTQLKHSIDDRNYFPRSHQLA